MSGLLKHSPYKAIMPAKSLSEPRRDRSALARVVHDFGLLLINDDFKRYLDDPALRKKAMREDRMAEYVSLEEKHDQKFVPLIPLLGIELLGKDPHYHHHEVLDRLQRIDAFLNALKLTVDFSLEVAELHKRLRRKFEGEPSKLTLPYRTKRLISAELVKHCRDVMWIVQEFHVEPEDEDDIDGALWDVNIWTVILEADRLHREHGQVHSAFFNFLTEYQSRRGGGRPKSYLRTAMAVLLAECFVDYEKLDRKPQIHDKSTPVDRDQYQRLVERRNEDYDS